MGYRLLADIVLLTHAAFIGFVIFALVFTLLGGALGWQWVRRPLFRLTHLACIGLVIGQAWAGVACPLTLLENHLRRAAGQSTYARGFIADWVQPLIFFDLETWMFTLVYSVFGLLVALTLWLVPIQWRRLRLLSRWCGRCTGRAAAPRP